MTAKEAREKTNSVSRIEFILTQIKLCASQGKSDFYFVDSKVIEREQLVKLGYKIKANWNSSIFNPIKSITISW